MNCMIRIFLGIFTVYSRDTCSFYASGLGTSFRFNFYKLCFYGGENLVSAKYTLKIQWGI